MSAPEGRQLHGTPRRGTMRGTRYVQKRGCTVRHTERGSFSFARLCGLCLPPRNSLNAIQTQCWCPLQGRWLPYRGIRVAYLFSVQFSSLSTISVPPGTALGSCGDLPWPQDNYGFTSSIHATRRQAHSGLCRRRLLASSAMGSATAAEIIARHVARSNSASKVNCELPARATKPAHSAPQAEAPERKGQAKAPRTTRPRADRHSSPSPSSSIWWGRRSAPVGPLGADFRVTP